MIIFKTELPPFSWMGFFVGLLNVVLGILFQQWQLGQLTAIGTLISVGIGVLTYIVAVLEKLKASPIQETKIALLQNEVALLKREERY